MRVLRTYTRIAQIQHWCDRCCRYIEPGEYYEGSVQLYSNPRRLIVFKIHIEPSCDYPPDPEELEEIINEEESLWKIAA